MIKNMQRKNNNTYTHTSIAAGFYLANTRMGTGRNTLRSDIRPYGPHLFAVVFHTCPAVWSIPASAQGGGRTMTHDGEGTHKTTNSHRSSSSWIYDPASIYNNMKSCIRRW